MLILLTGAGLLADGSKNDDSTRPIADEQQDVGMLLKGEGMCLSADLSMKYACRNCAMAIFR